MSSVSHCIMSCGFCSRYISTKWIKLDRRSDMSSYTGSSWKHGDKNGKEMRWVVETIAVGTRLHLCVLFTRKEDSEIAESELDVQKSHLRFSVSQRPCHPILLQSPITNSILTHPINVRNNWNSLPAFIIKMSYLICDRILTSKWLLFILLHALCHCLTRATPNWISSVVRSGAEKSN